MRWGPQFWDITAYSWGTHPVEARNDGDDAEDRAIAAAVAAVALCSCMFLHTRIVKGVKIVSDTGVRQENQV